MAWTYTVEPDLQTILAGVSVSARRLYIDNLPADATIAQLRGAWGAALHDLDESAYRDVFCPDEAIRMPHPEPIAGCAVNMAQIAFPVGRISNPSYFGRAAGNSIQRGGAVSRYILRPSPCDQAIDWILLGDEATVHDSVLCRAWDVALARGIGSARRPALLRRLPWLGPDGAECQKPGPWTLADVATAAAPRPPVLHMPTPLRLMRQGRLITRPTLGDLVVAGRRRVAAFLPREAHDSWDATVDRLLDEARSSRDCWRGGPLHLRRYSSSQHCELTLHGVSGHLQLGHVPSPELGKLLAALEWIHVGKATVFGLGQICVDWRG